MPDRRPRGLLNLAYFGVEFSVALSIGSVSLFADSIDFLEDTSINFLILIALGWSARHRSHMGMALAGILLIPGLATIWTAWDKFLLPVPAPIIGRPGFCGAGLPPSVGDASLAGSNEPCLDATRRPGPSSSLASLCLEPGRNALANVTAALRWRISPRWSRFRSALLHSALNFRPRRSCPFSCYSATTGRGASQ